MSMSRRVLLWLHCAALLLLISVGVERFAAAQQLSIHRRHRLYHLRVYRPRLVLHPRSRITYHRTRVRIYRPRYVVSPVPRFVSRAPVASINNPSPPPADAKDMVWVNTKSGIYWYPSSRYYGNTKQGRYMTESEASQAGFRPGRGQ